MKLNLYKSTDSYLQKHHLGNYYANVALADHTWYHIGGEATFLVYPHDLASLQALIKFCKKNKIRFAILGYGANILASDDGFDGIVIKLTKYFNKIFRIDEDRVKVQAGVALSDLIFYCEEHYLGGLACLAGIPSTVGGATIMNAGVDQGCIGDTIEEVVVLDEDTNLLSYPKEALDINYRSIDQLQNKIILEVTLRLQTSPIDELEKIRKQQLETRLQKQPLDYPSCGSVFKRPAGHYVGKMVEDLGLKGTKKNDAMISEKHAGFIINCNKAKAEDVLYLMRLIYHKVWENYHIELEPEVRLLGFDEDINQLLRR
jgi:UDP-N-acetylmuramate dehydrogenase